jgi:O-acetyl-ADP-ribose deacetylase (regulator of RNase III)
MITKYINGDITETELKYIAHGVNCQNVMGSGVAKALFTKWPEVKEQYHAFTSLISLEKRLGMCTPVTTSSGTTIYNCYTQFNYGYNGHRYVSYAAVVQTLSIMSKDPISGPVAIPKIGCGLAGGNWTFMEQLINDTVGDKLEIWVYDNNTLKSSGKNDLA